MLNNTNLMGRLIKDPELKTLDDGRQVANFTLAVNRPKYGEAEQKTDFPAIVAWRKTAEFVGKYFKKGMQVYVVGRIQTRSWDAGDGTKRYATDIIASEVGFAESKKKEGNGDNGEPPANYTNGAPPEPDDDDLPF